MATDLKILDRAFDLIMRRMVETGVVLHYTELAAQLGCSVEEGRAIVYDIAATGYPAWLHPDTDWFASFPPFSNIPTHHRITVDGQQKWFAQWGFETLAVCWLFPGKPVGIYTPCLDCNGAINVEIRDGEVLSADPPTIVGHTNTPWGARARNWARAWGQMNLFRSEEHVRSWPHFNPESAEGTMPLADWVHMYSVESMKHMLDGDYLSRWQPLRGVERQKVMDRLGMTSPFWRQT